MQGGHTQKILSTIFEYIFPSFCVSCNAEGKILCDFCLGTLEVPGVFCCPVCHTERPQGMACMHCGHKTPLTSHIAMMPLTETALIHRLIHLYKYQYVELLEETFKSLVTTFFETHHVSDVDYIVPVPLHKKRYVERGFNQSERIADMVSVAISIPTLSALKRSVNTVKQATLDRKGREMNVKDAFVTRTSVLDCILGKRIVLIDDVYTTGSTLSECAHALIRAGALTVSGFSIARG